MTTLRHDLSAAGPSRAPDEPLRRHDLLRRRLTSQLLAGAVPRGPEAVIGVTERLLAIQAQDPRGARLAIRARSRGATAADVDRALSEDRSLLITWLCRGTLHLVTADDYPLLQALTTPQLMPRPIAGWRRRASRDRASGEGSRRSSGRSPTMGRSGSPRCASGCAPPGSRSPGRR